jgi:hypothetical protein
VSRPIELSAKGTDAITATANAVALILCPKRKNHGTEKSGSMV